MKKNRFLWALLLLVSLGAAAQDNIHFVAGTPTQKGLSQAASKTFWNIPTN